MCLSLFSRFTADKADPKHGHPHSRQVKSIIELNQSRETRLFDKHVVDVNSAPRLNQIAKESNSVAKMLREAKVT